MLSIVSCFVNCFYDDLDKIINFFLFKRMDNFMF